MRKAHFFRVLSNLGTRLLWKGTVCDLQATKTAPRDFLDDKILSDYPSDKVDEYIYRDSAGIDEWGEYVDAFAKETAGCADLIEEKMRNGEAQVVVGGEHSIALASVIADLRRFKPEEIGVLVFDSHEDFMQSEISRQVSTGNWHGMWLRPLFTKFDVPKIDRLVPIKIPLENLMYVGNLDIEEEPAEFFAKHKIKVISGDEIEKNSEQAVKQMNNFCERFKHIHVSFDFDILKARNFNPEDQTSCDVAVNLPYEGGLEKPVVENMIEGLKLPESFSLDLVELNATRASFEKTKEFGKQVLRDFLNK